MRGVAVAFGGQRVLDGLDFSLRAGEFAVLGGGNGSGKTVLLNLAAGYLTPDRGLVRVRLAGGWRDVRREAPAALARQGVGRLWQDIRLFPTMTVLDNVLAATPDLARRNSALAVLARAHVARQERAARERALANLARLGMAERAGSSCDMLSTGQMKRVALARLLQMEARLFLLDEPFAGLDPAAAAALAKDLGRLHRECGATILLVEHRREWGAGLTDRRLRLEGGRIAEAGDDE